MTLSRLHSSLVIAGAMAVPAVMIVAWMTIYSPWLGNDNTLITEPRTLNAVQFALASCGAIGTTSLCFWAADNIRPIPFIGRTGVASLLTFAIACAWLSIVLAFVELALTYQSYGGDSGEGWVSIVGYSMWSVVSTLVFIPVLLFARAQNQQRSQNAPLSGSAFGDIFE